MKKQFLMLVASSVLLASCGGSSVEPLKEPETKETINRTQMMTHVAKLGENLTKVEAFGVDVKSSFDAKLSFATVANKESGLTDATYSSSFSISESKESFAIKKVGDAAILSATASSKYSYDINFPSISEGEDGKNKVETKSVKDSGSFSVSAYILENEPNKLYADLSGMKEVATKLVTSLAGKQSAAQVEEIFGKVIVTFDEGVSGVLANLPSYAGLALASILGSDSWKDMVSSAQEDKNVYKVYTDGSYGITSTLDFKDVFNTASSLLPSSEEGVGQVISILSTLGKNLTGNASTLLIFTEDTFKAAGASASAKLEGLPEGLLPTDGIKDVKASLNAEVRADFLTGADVKVGTLSDKTGYKAVNDKAE